MISYSCAVTIDTPPSLEEKAELYYFLARHILNMLNPPKEHANPSMSSGTTNYGGARFGEEGSLGIGVYRDNSVCYGEAPARLETHLNELNSRGPSRNVKQLLHVDLGAMLILAVGNPTHLGFCLRGSIDQIELQLHCKEKIVSRNYLYRNPQQQRSFYNPGELSDHPGGLDLSVISCLAGARIALLIWNDNIESPERNLSLGQRAMWNYLVTRGVAEQTAGESFQVSRDIAESATSADILRVLIKQELWRKDLTESPHYAMPVVSPSARSLRSQSGLSNVDLWLKTSQGQ